MAVVASTYPDPTHKDLGDRHYMTTHADLYDNGGIAAWTETKSETWFGGYIGTVVVLAYDSNGQFIGATEQQRFGVNGTAWGQSRRTDVWHHTWDPTFAQRAAGGRLIAAHGWRFEARAIAKIAEAAKTITPFLLTLL